MLPHPGLGTSQMETQKKHGIVALVSSVAVVLMALMSPSSHAWVIDSFDLAMGYEDAITNSISIRLTGTDYTTYLHGKLEVQAGKTFDPWSHTRFSEMPLCGDDRSEWLALRCRAMKTNYRQPHCGSKNHCYVFQLAAFIRTDEALRNATTDAIEHPAKYLFGPDEYATAFGVGDLHAPGLALSPPAAKDIARELARRRPGALKEVETGIFVLTFDVR